MSAYRKGHNTTTVILAMRDDILQAMQRGEVTMAVLADYSKAFDTVTNDTVLKKMHSIGFSKDYLRWLISYLTGRQQFVQIDDKVSDYVNVSFGVPQGSILGPVLFNIYVNDLSDNLDSIKSYQYTDDTTIYIHEKPANLKAGEEKLQKALDSLASWSSSCNLSLNAKKTKVVLFSTKQLSRVHELDAYPTNLSAGGTKLERLTSTKLLGATFQENLKWNEDIQSKISCSYHTLSVLRKLGNLAPFHVRKQLAECLIFSKLYYNDIVYHQLPNYLLRRLQRVQLAASFVIKRYAKTPDITDLGWSPFNENRDLNLCKTTFKAMYDVNWPAHLRVTVRHPNRTLRSSTAVNLEVPKHSGTLQDQAAKVFNSLPVSYKNCTEYKQFVSHCKKFFIDKARINL